MEDTKNGESFLGNYKTVLGKAAALQKAIDKDLAEGLVSGPFPESEVLAKYHRVLLNSLGAEIEDLAKPDVGTLVDATQGGPTNTSVWQCNPQDLVLRLL